MDPLKHSWPGLGMECPFCSHTKCRACLEVSVNILACCVCRSRAIKRLAYLKETWARQEPAIDDGRRISRVADEKQHSAESKIRRLPVG